VTREISLTLCINTVSRLGDSTLLSIYELAWSIYPLFGIKDGFINEQQTPNDLKDTDMADLRATNTVLQFKRFLNLSTEIRIIISTFSQPNRVSSLFTARQISSKVSKSRLKRTIVFSTVFNANNYF
jgi:hypothetical protein